MGFTLDAKSQEKLTGVHADLIKLVNDVAKISPLKFSIIEGLRDVERQKQMVAAGKSQTKNSRHLTGHAIDFAVFVGNTVTWEWKNYEQLATLFKQEASKLNIKIIWGGDWKTLKDGDHIELDRTYYP